MRVLFMGTPDFAVPSLQGLLDGDYRVVGVVTQPDRPKGRGGKTLPSPVKKVALAHGLAVYQPGRITEIIDFWPELSPHVVVVAAFGRILPVEILSLPAYGCVNVHASLLPRYRGAAPIHRAVMNGEKETGITTMFMDEGLDTGDMILQRAAPIGENDNVGLIHDRLADLGARVLAETLELIRTGRAPRIPQDERLATYAPPLGRGDELINWDGSARSVCNQIRGMDPWPGAATFWGDKILKIWRAEIISEKENREPLIPGQVLSTNQRSGIIVQTGRGQVGIVELQLQGARRMTATTFLRGRLIAEGTVLGKAPCER
ncbi:MAG: methionyl-tRNA formyltransferase [Peptococcaceae bacterium]|nr:MAG: methionyl-tRNA formyltransferase [Peptococcaceae bacterium]